MLLILILAEKDFHTPPEQQQVTTKLKAIRQKYRKAVNEGKRSGHGRVVAVYYEMCEAIWGGSPATQPTDGVETPTSSQNSQDVDETETTSTTSSSDIESEVAVTPTPTTADRRALLDDRLKNHKTDRLKRKIITEQQSIIQAKEEVEIKKQMLAKLEEMDKKTESQSEKVFGTLERMARSMEALVGLAQSQQAANNYNPPYMSNMAPPPPAMHPQQYQQPQPSDVSTPNFTQIN